MRRTGKSTLLLQYQQQLKDNGIQDSQIISVNFEELENEDLLEYHVLYHFIKERLNEKEKYYIFLDEVQLVDQYEKVVDSLYIKDNIDIYITGSNSGMLSSDLATRLSGRYIEINMLPLSFKEFLELTSKPADEALRDYMEFGSLPGLVTMNDVQQRAKAYLEGLYNTVIVKDILERQKRKERDPNLRKVTDSGLLRIISRYLTSVVGSLTNVKSITNYLTSSGRKIGASTVDAYTEALTEAFIFYPSIRFNIQGKETLKGEKKYYIVDLGLRHYLLPKSIYDLGFSLENIVFFELLRRGYEVYTGKMKMTEVDFVARKGQEIQYIQVTASLLDSTTFEREIKPLKMIPDNFPKIILTLDRYTPGNYEGIQVIHAIDWLLEA